MGLLAMFNVNELTVSTNKVSLSKHTVNKALWRSGDKGWWLAGPCPPLVPFCHCCSVAKACPTLCDPTVCSTPASLSFTISRSDQTRVH